MNFNSSYVPQSRFYLIKLTNKIVIKLIMAKIYSQGDVTSDLYYNNSLKKLHTAAKVKGIVLIKEKRLQFKLYFKINKRKKRKK